MNAKYHVYIVDDDPEMRRSLAWMLNGAGVTVEGFACGEEFLRLTEFVRPSCVLLDVYMPHLDGIELQRHLSERADGIPVIFMSGHADIPTAVHAMEAGAVSFIEKPFTKEVLLAATAKAVERSERLAVIEARCTADQGRLARLTQRERQVLTLVADGEPTKRIAMRLGLSSRTVDKHRQRILAKTRAESWTELAALQTRLSMKVHDEAPYA